MTKRALVFLILNCTCGLAFGQGQPFWNCGSASMAKRANLICLLPVATQSVSRNPLAPAINSAFATQLSQLPTLSSGPAIAVTYDAVTGVPVVSNSLGPVLTDRPETIGRHRLLLAFGYQRFNFNSVDGTNLNSLPFVFHTDFAPNTATQYTVEKENVGLTLDQYVGVVTFGLTKKIDISAIVPVESVNIISRASTFNLYTVGPDNTAQGQATSALPRVSGSASGFGDVIINAKGVVYSGEKDTVAAGMLVRFPTGDALNYLGSGAYGFDPYVVWSHPFSKISPHVRLGYQFNTATVLIPDATTGLGSSTLPGGLQYTGGADFIVLSGQRPLTVAADFIGNYVVNSPWLAPGYAPLNAPSCSDSECSANTTTVSPFPYPSFVQTVKYTTKSYNSDQIALGLKFEPWKDLIIAANVTFQVNNVGLKSSPVPLVGIAYTFKP